MVALLTPPQIAAYAYRAGIHDSGDLATATAIALAESGGNADAHTVDSDDDSYGLWQINMLGAMGPSRTSQFNLSKPSDLLNPATNARAMYALSSSGKSWGAWSTYTSIRYKAFLIPAYAAAESAIVTKGAAATITDAVGNAVGAVGDAASAPADAIKGVVEPFQKIATAVQKSQKWLADRNNITRIVMVAGGAIGLAAGMWLLFTFDVAAPVTASGVKLVTGGTVKQAAVKHVRGMGKAGNG